MGEKCVLEKRVWVREDASVRGECRLVAKDARAQSCRFLLGGGVSPSVKPSDESRRAPPLVVSVMHIVLRREGARAVERFE